MPAATLQPGLRHEFTFTVPPDKTVPHLYPEATDFNLMPEVFAPPGMEVTTSVELTRVDGRLLEFAVESHDGVDTIARGTHRRAVVDAAKFKARAAAKAASAGV